MTAEAFAEVVGTPYEVYRGAVGTTVPKIDAEPGTGWTFLGRNGSENQGTKGVTIGLAETVASFRPNGRTLIVKDWRTAEDPMVQFSLVDTSVETVAAILDDADITTTNAATGVAGEKAISVIRGVQVKYFALLVRGLSPDDDGTGLRAQWEFGRVCQSGSQSIAYVLGTPAEVDCEFAVRALPSGVDEGIYRAQNAAAL